MEKIRVTVWNEYRHELKKPEVAAIYPDGIHNALARYFERFPEFEVKTATLDMPEHGLTDEVLKNTDVLLWWGHLRHQDVSDEVAYKVVKNVQCGMGFIALHSAHASKPFRYLMGTSCGLAWREDGDNARLWVVDPSHPIVAGVGDCLELPAEECYCEPFDIPTPDELLFISWYKGGEVLRSGCTFKRGLGKIFYFQPGHETYPIYHNEQVLSVIKNAVYWAKPAMRTEKPYGKHVTSKEKLTVDN